MDNSFSPVRVQLEQVLKLERAQRQARRRQRKPLWQALRKWWDSGQAQPARLVAKQGNAADADLRPGRAGPAMLLSEPCDDLKDAVTVPPLP